MARSLVPLLHQERAIWRMLAAFDRVCNLVNETGDVIALVTPAVGNGPLNIVLHAPPPIWTTSIFYLSITPARICLDQLEIDLRPAALWEPRPAWDQLYPLASNLAHVQKLARQHAGSLFTSPSRTEPPTPWRAAAQAAARALHTALAARQLAAARQAAAQLAGLGNGLTPAGDDFLMGAMAWLWLTGQGNMAAELAACAAPRTTWLAAAMLRAAGQGNVSAAWHEWLAALGTPDTIRLERATRAILTCGHTSGADALAGFCEMIS